MTQKSRRRHSHPGNVRIELMECGVPGCGTMQSLRHMEDVLVIEDVGDAHQVSILKACRKHHTAFRGSLPAIKRLLDAAYGAKWRPSGVSEGRPRPAEPGL